MTPTSFFVAGIPIPQGSKKAFVVGKRAVIVDANKELLRPWREQIARVAFGVFAFRDFIDGPCRVDTAFVFARPASVKRELPSVKPDLDKLVRAVFDGLTEAGNVWRDDSLAVGGFQSKVYGVAPGVHITLAPVHDATQLVAPAWDAPKYPEAA